MTTLPKKPKTQQRDPSLIDQSHIEIDQENTLDSNALVSAETSVELEKVNVQNDILREQAKREKIKNEILEKNLKKVFRFVVCYCIFLAITLLLSGFSLCGFHLSDTVFGFMITGLGISVIGLIATILKGLLR